LDKVANELPSWKMTAMQIIPVVVMAASDSGGIFNDGNKQSLIIIPAALVALVVGRYPIIYNVNGAFNVLHGQLVSS